MCGEDDLLKVLEDILREAGVESLEEVEICIEGDAKTVSEIKTILLSRFKPAYVSKECGGGVYSKKVMWCGREVVFGIRSLLL